MASRRLWVPVLVGLLVAGVLGVASGGAVAVEPRTVTASIMIPAAAFIPNADSWDYINTGDDLFVDTGSGVFVAPLSFPVPVVNIKRITLYAYDSSVGQVCVRLYRSRPAAHTQDTAGTVCTVGNSAYPQTVSTTAISPKGVNTAFHGLFLWVNFSAAGIHFYGVRINYSYEAGA